MRASIFIILAFAAGIIVATSRNRNYSDFVKYTRPREIRNSDDSVNPGRKQIMAYGFGKRWGYGFGKRWGYGFGKRKNTVDKTLTEGPEGKNGFGKRESNEKRGVAVGFGKRKSTVDDPNIIKHEQITLLRYFPEGIPVEWLLQQIKTNPTFAAKLTQLLIDEHADSSMVDDY
ncbi:uncharacterized protein LOC122402777 [Colletes gigas]|uniref:uncharacterized protein LOC122402777 n=1 Tax=Colletes gigas TaxID=935657 RepID=UPI001C9B876A|nr:uncharacterized protein LOC122402777 [Colletes gigas]